jgi:hypothetical protein
MKWFGKDWGASICKDTEHAPRPSDPCFYCETLFTEDDKGIITPFSGGPDDPPEAGFHLNCFLESVGIDRVVHVLYHGFPLCRFTEELPGDWPAGHVWASTALEANCEMCSRAARELDL